MEGFWTKSLYFRIFRIMERTLGSNKCTLRALFDYEPEGGDDLELVKGKMYRGLSLEDGWWRGFPIDDTTKTLKSFPSNYVERVEEEEKKTTSIPKQGNRAARLDQMKRQSIFAPPINHSTINPKLDQGTRKRKNNNNNNNNNVAAVQSIDGPKGQSKQDAIQASEDARKHQKLTRRSQQSHTLRYSVFSHNIAAVSAVFLLLMSPISMLWGTECLSMSLTEGELGVLVVDGAPRVRVNSPLSREAAIASGVNPEFMIETFSACRGESDWWIGVISGISSLFILFIIEPFCGNRRDSKSGKCPGCVLCSRVGAGQETLNITFPWRSILYLLLGGASAGTAPTAIPACGLLVASVMHMVVS